MKKIVVVVVLLGGTWIGLDQWGAGKLRAYEASWKGKVASLRDEAARRRVPVLRGSASRDENAATIEKDVLARLEARYDSKTTSVSRSLSALSDVITRSPFAPAGEGEMALLEENRAVADDIARAAQCTRCDWEIPYDQGVGLEMRIMLTSRAAANLALAAGHERARAGDLRGAADRYLDTARFGADIGHGTLGSAMTWTPASPTTCRLATEA